MIFILYLHSPEFLLSTDTHCLLVSLFLLERKEWSCIQVLRNAVAMSIAIVVKLRIALNYYNILFTELISFLGMRLFCKNFSKSVILIKCRNWFCSHRTQLVQIGSSGVFYNQYHRIFMHLKVRTVVMLYSKCDFQRMKPDSDFHTTCELFLLC